MHVGLAISLLLHTALIAWALVSIAAAPRKLDAPDPVPVLVDVVTPSDIARMQQGVREAKLAEVSAKEPLRPEPPKEAPKTKVVTPPPPPPPPTPPPSGEPPPPPPPPETKTPPPPPPKAADPIADKLAALPPPPDGPSIEEVMKREERKRAAEKAAEERQRAEEERKRAADEARKKADDDKRKAEAKARADEAKKRAAEKRKEAERKAAEDKRRKDFDDLQRRLALESKEAPKAAPAPASGPSSPSAVKGPRLGDVKGADKQISADKLGLIRSLMRQAIRDGRCWNFNTGADGVAAIVVEVEVRLNRDGTITGTPRVANTNGSPLFRDMADSAVRALVKCAPYRLPADLYEGGWQHMIVEFDPREMF